MGPRSDLLFIYGSPIIALGLIHVLLHVPFLNRDVTIGEPTSVLLFAVGSITFAHLLPVFVRSHLNGAILRSFRVRLLVVPPVLVFVLTVWPAAFIVAGMVAGFWDVYHTAQQNFGLGRIYDSRAGVASDVNRRADRLISHVLYLGPILAGPSMLDHVGELDSLDQVGWTLLARVPDNSASWASTLRWIVIAVMVIAVTAYVIMSMSFAKHGVRSSPQKVALMAVSAVVQILAWGFSSPLVAFMVVNLYHAVQYFALVWHIEGRNVAGYLRLRRARTTLPVGLVAVFAVPAAFGALVNGTVPTSALVAAMFLSVSLLHFWMDGFIWSVRAKAV